MAALKWIPEPSPISILLARQEVTHGSPQEDPNRAGVLIGVVAAFLALSTLAVGMRCWVRIVMTKQGLSWDDGFVIISAVFNIALNTVIALTTKYNMGRHVQYALQSDFKPLFKLIYATSFFYFTAIWAVKTSLILFYHRLSMSTYFHAWCYGYIILNTIFWIASVLVSTFFCDPIAYFWDVTIPGGKCLSIRKIFVGTTALVAFTDIAALLLPIQAIYKMKINLWKKLQLATMFGFGFIVCIASFIRMHSLIGMSQAEYNDVTWILVDCYSWTTIEVSLAIVTTSAPMCKLFFTRYALSRIIGSSVISSNPSEQHRKQSDNSRNKSGSNNSSNKRSGSNMFGQKKKFPSLYHISTNHSSTTETTTTTMGDYANIGDVESEEGEGRGREMDNINPKPKQKLRSTNQKAEDSCEEERNGTLDSASTSTRNLKLVE